MTFLGVSWPSRGRLSHLSLFLSIQGRTSARVRSLAGTAEVPRQGDVLATNGVGIGWHYCCYLCGAELTVRMPLPSRFPPDS